MFGGGSSIQLGRILGIRIGVSPSWFIVLFLMVYLLSGYFGEVLDATSTTSYLVAVGGAACFFGSLILHELGHALAARRFGIGTAGIDLWFFGGIAKLERDTQSPREEFVVAAAGPAVTAAIVALCVAGGSLADSYGAFEDAARLREGTQAGVGLALVGWLAVVNAFLLVFNLVPAFPLDGGRIARAVAWKLSGDRHRATRASAYVGQGFAVLLIGFGVFLALVDEPLDGLWLGVLGWLLLQAARGAVVASRFTERLEGVTAGDLMDVDPVTVPSELGALTVQDDFFARYGWSWFCVVDPRGRFLGILEDTRVDGAVTAGQPTLPVGELLDADAQAQWQIPRETPLEALLVHEPLRRLGALAVVDGEERLVGVLSVDVVRRALAASAVEPARS